MVSGRQDLDRMACHGRDRVAVGYSRLHTFKLCWQKRRVDRAPPVRAAEEASRARFLHNCIPPPSAPTQAPSVGGNHSRTAKRIITAPPGSTAAGSSAHHSSAAQAGRHYTYTCIQLRPGKLGHAAAMSSTHSAAHTRAAGFVGKGLARKRCRDPHVNTPLVETETPRN